LFEPPRPLIAVEVRARTLGAVRMVREGATRRVAAAAVVPLPEGALSFSMTLPNVVDAQAFRDALRALFERIGGLSETQIALVLPDPVARIIVLPASETPAPKGTPSGEILRFRLRGKLPFDVREARLAEQALPRGNGRSASLVAVIHRLVLASYEEACRSADLEPGLIEMCTLCLERSLAHASSGDRLVINWEDRYTSLVLSRAGAPLLVRTLPGPTGLGEVVREVSNTLMYHRERLGGTAIEQAYLRSCALPVTQAAELLSSPLGLTPAIIDPIGACDTADLEETSQAVAAAAACVQSAT
jgi:Tfp pilus assembly PilM family ATPase